MSFAGAETYNDFGDHWAPNGHLFVADPLLAPFARGGIAAAQPTRGADAAHLHDSEGR